MMKTVRRASVHYRMVRLVLLRQLSSTASSALALSAPDTGARY